MGDIKKDIKTFCWSDNRFDVKTGFCFVSHMQCGDAISGKRRTKQNIVVLVRPLFLNMGEESGMHCCCQQSGISRVVGKRM